MFAASLLAFGVTRILFIGNSHTEGYDIPGQVHSLLGSAGIPAHCESEFVGTLNEVANQAALFKRIRDGKWDFVVLQGAEISQSHKFRYSQDNPKKFAKAALQAGAKPLLFAEWPREGWDESEFILGVYRETTKAVKGAEIVPVCLVFDYARKQHPKLAFWSDGNHTTEVGAYVAACTLAHWVGGEGFAPSWAPKSLDTKLANALRQDVRTKVDSLRR